MMNIPELKISKEDAKQLRAGNILRLAVGQIGGRVLEVVIQPIWEPDGSDVTQKPIYETTRSEFSVYSANSDEPSWRGSAFRITLADPEKL